MSDIIRTWPANLDAHTVAEMFSATLPPWCTYYFTLGRGMPKRKIDRLWFTWRGRILGYFYVDEIIVNDGSLPRLHSLSGGESEWQIAKDAKIAICSPPCIRLKERIFHEGFRGWRYFNIDEWRANPESRHRL